MRYSHEFKMECVEMYKKGRYPETPEGIQQKNFRLMVRRWVRRAEGTGGDALRHRSRNRAWTAEERYSLVAQVMAGKSIQEVAFSAGLNQGQLYSWVRKYKIEGYQGLVHLKRGRPYKEPSMKKEISPKALTESEREELIRLKAENEYLKAENEAIKKSIALRQEKIAAQLKAKKQPSSKNSEKKDTP